MEGSECPFSNLTMIEAARAAALPGLHFLVEIAGERARKKHRPVLRAMC